MARKYANPPIIEAVCEFRIVPDPKWDLTVPGMFYEKVQSDYPQKERQMVQEVAFIQGKEVLEQEVRTIERMRFLTNDRKLFIQVAPNFLSVNCLKPYLSWEKFKPKIEKAFHLLTDTVEVKAIQRIGLRFINRIEIPGHGQANFEDYFEFYPFLGQGLPQPVHGFMTGCVFLFNDSRDSCRVQLRSAAREENGNIAFLLDLDYYLTKSQTVPVHQALEWVEEAPQHVEEIFEGCILDSLRKIFREIK